MTTHPHPLQLVATTLRVANRRANPSRARNPGGLLLTAAILGLAGLGAVVVWRHFADAEGAPATRAMTGRSGRFAWELDRRVDAGSSADLPSWYHYGWSVYDGNTLIANDSEYEMDEQLAYDKARAKIDATIAAHGGAQ